MMNIIDKHNILQNQDKYDELVLELGCGNRKKYENSIGIDILDTPCVDIVGDVYEVLGLIHNSKVKMVYSHHFLEHVSDIPRLMKELERVLIHKGELEIIVPHFSNPYYYSDPTHRSFFGIYTFCYLAKSTLFSRSVPSYDIDLNFSLTSVELVFKSSRPFYIRHFIKSFIGLLFNSSNYMRELYEENFCYLLPCYQICYKLEKQ